MQYFSLNGPKYCNMKCLYFSTVSCLHLTLSSFLCVCVCFYVFFTALFWVSMAGWSSSKFVLVFCKHWVAGWRFGHVGHVGVGTARWRHCESLTVALLPVCQVCLATPARETRLWAIHKAFRCFPHTLQLSFLTQAISEFWATCTCLIWRLINQKLSG